MVKVQTTAAPVLSRDQANDLQRMLIKEYSTPEFQRKLHDAFGKAGKDLLAQGKARQEVCLPVQGPVISKFGFEPTRAGVQKSTRAFGPELEADPEIALGTALLAWLVSPDVQKTSPPPEGHEMFLDGRSLVGFVAPPTADNPVWRVVGGHDKGGIVVRQSLSTSSPECNRRLSYGAHVEQLDLENGRLHYRRLDGEGPDFGWVSIAFKGKEIMTCLDKDD